MFSHYVQTIETPAFVCRQYKQIVQTSPTFASLNRHLHNELSVEETLILVTAIFPCYFASYCVMYIQLVQDALMIASFSSPLAAGW